MACHLFGAKPLSEPLLPYWQLDQREHISLKIYLNSKVSTQENALENVVCEMVAILASSVLILKWLIGMAYMDIDDLCLCNSHLSWISWIRYM